MIEATFYGRAKFLTMAANAVLSPYIARVWSVNPTVPGLILTIPTVTFRQIGGPVLIIFNVGANTVTLSRDAGTVPLPAGQSIILTITPLLFYYGVPRVTGAGVTAVSYRGVYVAGGAGLTTSAAAYNAIANTWGATGGIPNPKQDAVAMALGPFAFVVGLQPITPVVSNQTDELSTAGAWITRKACPFLTSRGQGANFPTLGKVKLFSGTGTPNTAEYTGRNGDAWTVRAAVPYAKTRGSAQAIGEKAYIVSGEPVPIANIGHDPVADAYWTIAFGPGQARHSMGTFATNGKMNAVGGREDVGPTRFDLNEEYDPLVDAWTSKALIAGGPRHAGAGVGGNFRGYLMGGRDGADAASNVAQSYSLDAWTLLTAMPAARADTQNAGASI